MTSQGHAYTRLRRVLETRSSALMIRAAAAELPSVPLEDALDICLALLELEDAQAHAFELGEELADAREELEAVREINRELLADQNRPAG